MKIDYNYMVVDNHVLDQRTVVFTAYILMLEDPDKYITFRSRDIAKVVDVTVSHTSALIRKCYLAGLISKKGMKGRTMIYELTNYGVERGKYYFDHWNQITNTFY